jgi:hypothetical protein
MAKNEVTTDELAAMIQHGFEETARKDEVDKGFDDVDGVWMLSTTSSRASRSSFSPITSGALSVWRNRSRSCGICSRSSRGASLWA